MNTFLNEREMKFFGVVKQRNTIMMNNFENIQQIFANRPPASGNLRNQKTIKKKKKLFYLFI